MDQNHLGKFLKLSSLNSPIVEYQLFNFSKESLKQIFLNSKCGEIINGKEFKDKPSNSDLVGTKNIYPLICIYKKAKPKIKSKNHILYWKNEKIKKKIDILSNTYMTLSILTLAEYYKEIIKDEKKQKEVFKFYVSSAKCQLNYYVNNFRNDLGLFVNKRVNENNNKKESSDITFETIDDSFDFSTQAYMMVAFTKCSNMLKDTSPYKIPFLNFSYEIEKMFKDFNKDILNCKTHKLVELLNAFQLYLDLNPQINNEFLRMLDSIIEYFSDKNLIYSIGTYHKILLYKTLSNLKSYFSNNQFENSIQTKNLISEYIWELEDFFSNPEFETTEILNAQDLISYQIHLTRLDNKKSNNFYNDVLIPSKIFTCFPNIPQKYESEKYFQFEHKQQNLIPDKYFKPNSYKTMNETDLTPIICKNIHFSHRKNKFSKPKIRFHSLLNMKLIFYILSNLKDTIIKATR